MKKLLLLAAASFALPNAAHAAATASTGLSTDAVNYVFTGTLTPSTGELFSQNTAALGVGGTVTNANTNLPGTADAAQAVDGTIDADSFVTSDAGGNNFFSNEANGTVDLNAFGSAIGDVSASFEFANATPGLGLTIVLDFTRIFELSADAEDTAVGRTAINFGIRNAAGVDLLPTITLSNPDCNPSATFSVTDGATFDGTCTGTATFAFENLEVGDFTLSFGSASSIDVTAEQTVVPAPAALALFGLGLAGLAFRRRA